MSMTIQLLLALLSGALVSFLPGLFGGGGSMLALPLLVHVVDVPSPHVAIGISAAAVAANALMNLGMHARHKRVKWPCAILFSGSGLLGVTVGTALGKAVNGQALLTAFGVLMVIVGALMLRNSGHPGEPDVRLTRGSARTLAPPLIASGFAIGAASGFFGIGGGFLITPALMWATDMPIALAIGTSLVAVSAFGAATAVSYAASGLIDWPLTAWFVLGGALGGLIAGRLMRHLSARANALRPLFAAFVIAAGLYVAADGVRAFVPCPTSAARICV
jgi:uncharacterized membrane protein YfcA